MTQWRYLPDQHCYSALYGRHYLRLQKRDGVWQWFAERLESNGCEIIAGSSDTRQDAQAAVIDAANRSGDT